MSKLAIIGLVALALGLPISATASELEHHSVCSSASEMVACGKQGVKGNRKQFVAGVTRPVAPPTVFVVKAAKPAGFDWTSAGIGAAAAALVLALVAALAWLLFADHSRGEAPPSEFAEV